MPENLQRTLVGRMDNRPSSSGGNSLPPPGSVVMASVEEDSGNGLYILRWSGNRFAVTSRTPLAPGQTLILRSDVSEEGKPVLVVQGPALPAAGTPIPAGYGPNTRPASGDNPVSGEVLVPGQGIASVTPEKPPTPIPAGLVLEPLLETLPELALRSSQLLEKAALELSRPLPAVANPSLTLTPGSSPVVLPGVLGPVVTLPDASLVTSGEAAAVPLPGGLVATPLPGGVVASPLPGGLVATPLPGGLVASPLPGDLIATPLPGGLITSPLPGGLVATPLPGDLAMPDSVTLPGSLPAAADGVATIPTPTAPPPETGQAENPTPPGGTGITRPDLPGPLPENSGLAKASPLPLPGQSAAVTTPGLGTAAPVNEPSSTLLAGWPPGALETPPPATTAAAAANAKPNESPIPIPTPPGGEMATASEGKFIPFTSLTPPDLAGTSLTEALGQLIKGAELPLGQNIDSLLPQGKGQVPANIAERAAAILIRAGGLTPGPTSNSAAIALMHQGLPINRQNMQNILAFSALAGENDRDAFIQAAARLSGHDIPLSPPLVGGMADILGRQATTSRLVEQVKQALANLPVPANVETLLQTATRLLDNLSIKLDQPDSAQSLANHLAGLGRENLGQAMALIETATQAVLERHPLLPRIDQALTALFSELGKVGSQEGSSPPPPPASGTTPEVETPEEAAATGEKTPPAPSEKENPERAGLPRPETLLKPVNHGFSLPGVNSPEADILRPAGNLERWLLSDPPEERAALRQVVDRLVENLLSDQPAKASGARYSLANLPPSVLRLATTRLMETERATLAADPVLNRLADAASALRDLGRQEIATKAENLAGTLREPAVMLAEVPFSLAGQTGGEGRMQMFYRQRSQREGGWSARVILDLATTHMGPVLGDLRFFGHDLLLNLFASDSATVERLSSHQEELGQALRDKGFRLKPKFLLLPPPPPPPPANPPEPPSPTPPAAPVIRLPRRLDGRLDIEG